MTLNGGEKLIWISWIEIVLAMIGIVSLIAGIVGAVLGIISLFEELLGGDISVTIMELF